jgi:hypothetical protein
MKEVVDEAGQASLELSDQPVELLVITGQASKRRRGNLIRKPLSIESQIPPPQLVPLIAIVEPQRANLHFRIHVGPPLSIGLFVTGKGPVTQRSRRPASCEPSPMRSGRFDVGIEAEEIVGVVLPLERREPRIVVSVRRGHNVVILHACDVDVAPVGKRLELLE